MRVARILALGLVAAATMMGTTPASSKPNEKQGVGQSHSAKPHDPKPAAPKPKPHSAKPKPHSAKPKPHSAKPKPHSAKPDIVFVILDDVGIDQMTLFGNGGDDPPIVPNIDEIGRSGVTFSNTWAMPECSPSRASFFTGRFPLRTGVTSAILPQMVAQAQVSPYETTLPRLLRTAGYRSAMVGKYHLGNDNPSGNCSPATRGFDHFDGNMEAGPPAIDTTAGAADLSDPDTSPGPYQCGFYREDEGGANEPAMGACHYDDGRACEDQITGKECLESGGLLALDQSCSDAPPQQFFSNQNGYYVWPDTVTTGSLPAPSGCNGTGAGCADLVCPIGSAAPVPLSRDYMTSYQTQAAIAWWQQQTGPRMLTVSYNSIHTPYQQPPGSSADTDALHCSESRDDEQLLANAMFENMDREIGLLLAGLGLATLDSSGTVRRLHLDQKNTLLVIIGDNGTYAPAVKPPFSPLRAKGSVFQTGVWVPLIVAGPQVERRGRDVDALVNVVDLFELFAETAGVNPREVLPPAHRLDSQPLLPYLTEPRQEPIRSWNFTQLQPGGTIPVPVLPDERLWPCVLFSTATFDASGALESLSGGVCQDLLFDTKSFCESNNGLWFGPGSDYLAQNGGQPWNDCCSVAAQFSSPQNPVSPSPVAQYGVRNETFKLVEAEFPDCSQPNPDLFPPYDTQRSRGFYQLRTPPHVDYVVEELCSARDQLLPPPPPGCDFDGGSLDCPLKCSDGFSNCANAPACLLTQELRDNFDALSGTLGGIQASAIECPGDGNLDKRVTRLDLEGVRNFMGAGKSDFDVNKDGFTNQEDAQLVLQHMGTDCLGACRRADLNQDNLVDREDEALLKRSRGPCNVDFAADPNLCAADLNGDGVVDNTDLKILKETQKDLGGQPCPIVVVGQGDKTLDPPAVQAALDEAVLLGNGRVQLVGAFDFSDCNACVKIRGPVILQGTGDPSGPKSPDPTQVTTIKADNSAGPLVIRWDEDYHAGTIVVEKLWITSGVGGGLIMEETRGPVELRNNRVTGLAPLVLGADDDPRSGTAFRFGLAGAGFGPFRGQLEGSLRAIGNYVDTRDVPFPMGDDNGIAISATNFELVEMRGNRLYTRGESIELENNIFPGGRIEIVDNDVITDAAISPFAEWAEPVGFVQGASGGHPAAIKVSGGQVGFLLIEGNTVGMRGYPSAVCIMAGLNNEDSRAAIRRNRCKLDGQYAALLAGWAGESPFFPPFYLHDAVVEHNVFEGRARFGIAFQDWIFTGPGAGVFDDDLVNEGHDNVFRHNDMRKLETSDAALVFWSSTHDNLFIGKPHGTVIDQGRRNTIRP